MKRIALIILLLCIYCIGIVNAIPPVQTTTIDTIRTLYIAYPERTTFKLNEDFDLYFHIYNSNATSLDLASKVNCTIHIYNKSNTHIVNTGLSYASTNKEFEYKINHTALAMGIGFYPYIVSCNSSEGEYGFVKYGFYITPSGEDDSRGTANYAWLLIFIPLIFSFLLIKFGEGLSTDLDGLKLFMNWTAIISILFSTYFATEIIARWYFWDNMIENLAWYNEIIIYCLAVTMFVMLIIMIGRIFNSIGRKGREQ